MPKLNTEFIRRAERITSFNIETTEFETLCYKREIQTLIKKHFFPDFNLRTTLKKINRVELNKRIQELKTIDNEMMKKLHQYNLKGVGPGEVTLFFLVDLVHLGGGSSAGVDIVCGDEQYEVKAANITQERTAINFKLGGTVALADMMTELNDLRSYYGLEGTRTEIKGSVIKELRSKYNYDFNPIEEKFQEVASEYFSKHDVIFINNNVQNKTRVGMIESIKRVKKDDIKIERLTSGTIKPMVKL